MKIAACVKQIYRVGGHGCCAKIDKQRSFESLSKNIQCIVAPGLHSGFQFFSFKHAQGQNLLGLFVEKHDNKNRL